MGGKFHPKLNNGERPIANKYREGKMKRTLKIELKIHKSARGGERAAGGSEGAPVKIHSARSRKGGGR
jgi:hypothetical protein